MRLSVLLILWLLLAQAVFAQESIQDVFNDSLKKSNLKRDYQLQLPMISFEVNRILLSFTGYKPKLEQIQKDRPKIQRLINNIAPWAFMEKLEPKEVARIIVYMYKADQAGASFLDSEDLIPLVAKLDIPIKDFVVMVQYNKETKSANIPEELRQLFLTEAIKQRWDGASILAGGRGLLLAKNAGLDVNKTASLLLKAIPANGKSRSADELMAIVKKAINYNPRAEQVGGGPQLIANFTAVHEQIKKPSASNQDLVAVLDVSKKVAYQAQRIARAQDRKKTTTETRKEAGIIKDYDQKIPGRQNWQILSRSSLARVIKPWLGTRYKWGGKTGPPHGPGVDCSGFTRIVLLDKRIGVPKVPHGGAQKRLGRPVSLSNLRAGDLVFFSASPARRKITHVAITTSPTEFAHSSNRGVGYSKFTNRYWSKRMVLGRRIFSQVVD